MTQSGQVDLADRPTNHTVVHRTIREPVFPGTDSPHVAGR
jgi:hypothetical protein